jgi:hypothetical protein
MGGGKADTIDPIGAAFGRDNGPLNALNPASLAVAPPPPEAQAATPASKRKPRRTVVPGDPILTNADNTTLLG